MNLLYWITRLNAICIISYLVIIASIIILITCYLNISWKADVIRAARGYNNDAERRKCVIVIVKLKRLLKRSWVALSVSLLVAIITPTTHEAYIIYGVGGTIDYLQQNKDAKQLPDKCVKALNCFLDKEINDSTKTKEGGEK
jgi:flagellar biosynthesis protein FliP